MWKDLEKEEVNFLKKELYRALFMGFLILLLFVFLFFLALKQQVNIDPVAVIVLGILFSGGVAWLLGYDYYRDLRSGKKEIVEKTLEIHDDERKIKKTMVMSLVNAWGGKKKKKNKDYLLHVDYATYQVTRELAEEAEAKGKIKLHLTKYSHKVLKIEV